MITRFIPLPAVRWVPFCGCLLLTALTCAGLGRLDITQSATAEIPAATPVQQLLGSVRFAGFDNINFSQSETLQNQGIKKTQISSVKLKSFTLDIVAPEGQDFSFIDRLSFYVVTEGQPRQMIASGSAFGTRRSIGLDVTDVELLPYATAESMQVESEVSGEAPAQQTTIRATLVFDTQINIKGALCGS